MNRSELVREIAEKTGVSRKDAEKSLDATVETIMSKVSSGEKVQINGFGTFERKERKARAGRNPKTGGNINIAAKNVPAFRPGTEFKKQAI